MLWYAIISDITDLKINDVPKFFEIVNSFFKKTLPRPLARPGTFSIMMVEGRVSFTKRTNSKIRPLRVSSRLYLEVSELKP